MRFSPALRRVPAALSIALLLACVHSEAQARTEDANLISVTQLTLSPVSMAPTGVRGELIQATDGNFYLVSSTGGNGWGSIAQIAPDGTMTVLHAFADSTEGYASYAPLMQASDGNLYGTTYQGGDKGYGVVFRVSLAGDFAVLRSFGQNGQDASLPYTGLVQAPDGNLYGTTLRGGDNNQGTVYRISTSGDFAILHSFNGGDGGNPEGKLIVGADGALYGTTLQGGDSNRGTVYRITTSGTLTTLYSFSDLGAFNSRGVATNSTGANPRAGLLLGADGNYYGTTYQGGASGYGTVFRMTPAGALTVIHDFAGASFDGGYPLGGVVQDAAGNLYGTTQLGGYVNMGSAWRINTSGQFSMLHGFIGSVVDGSQPYASLLAVGSDLYGVSFTDPLAGAGAVFKFDLGSGGTLPVEFSVSQTEIALGQSATLIWSSPTAASCTASGSWSNTIDVSGSVAVTPAAAGIYTYTLSCTDAAGVVRNAYTAVSVSAPAAEPVDGGGGGGALSIPVLLLLGALSLRRKQ